MTQGKDGFITHDGLKKWLRSLTEGGTEVMVPVDRDGKVGYEALANVGDREVLVHFENTHRPPKEIIFPQTEVMLKYKRGGLDPPLQVKEIRPEMKETLIFGIRPCDAKGVHVMDVVFSGSLADPYYWDRRNKVALMGLACSEPALNCFCTIVGGSPHGTEGLDVLLTEIDDGFHALPLTRKGEGFLASDAFKDASDDHRSKAEEVHKKATQEIAREIEGGRISGDEMVKILAPLFDDDLWHDTSRGCLGCGTCTYLCPTCHCFDINDEGNELQGRRVRTWDTCQFPEFTLHTSSHNPRPVKKCRIRQRVYHKFKYMPENIGMLGCVGCGRCISMCPVNIDIFKVLIDTKEVGQ